MSTMQASARQVKPRFAYPEDAPLVYDADLWAEAVYGRLYDAATPEQRALAVEILTTNLHAGRLITPPGPRLLDLNFAVGLARHDEVRRARREARLAATAADWPSTDEIDGDRWATTEDEATCTNFEPASDEELESFDPDNLTFREIPDAPAEDRLTLAGWIYKVADSHRAIGTEAGDLVAETLESLARGVDRVSARTVEQYRDRWAAIEAEAL